MIEGSNEFWNGGLDRMLSEPESDIYRKLDPNGIGPRSMEIIEFPAMHSSG